MASTPEAPRTRTPEKTRERILDAAQALILDHGFGATTLDAVVNRAGITKGAFFHHFGSKSDLARSLVDRYAQLDREHLQRHWERAARLSSDPLQQLLILIGLYEEDFEALSEPFPGCLFASYIYENKLFDGETIGVLRESTLMWRRVAREMLEKVVAAHPPKVPVDLDTLADLFYALTEGSFVMTMTLGDKSLLARHSRHLRNSIEFLFTPSPARS